MSKTPADWTKPDYGVDAPAVMRNLFVFGGLALAVSFAIPPVVHLGPVDINFRVMLWWTSAFLLCEGLLFLLYVKYGKYRHRDFMLSLHGWRGDERVLDVGCGRGLLLAGAAKRLTSGHATGLDVWSNVDMGANSEAATQKNLDLEGVASLCTLVSEGAQDMSFADASFDVIVSNLCLHNIYDKAARTQALCQVARVLKPGGLALLSDYKLTAEYAAELRRLGFETTMKRGSLVTTFPPLRVVIARKPL